MKATIIALSTGLIASFVSAQSIFELGIPKCALGCYFANILVSGCRDFTCICGSNAFQDTFYPCIDASCPSSADFQTAFDKTYGICFDLGNPISLPPARTALPQSPSVEAQLNQIPQCALGCIFGGTEISGCANTDITCICGSNAFIASADLCVGDACTETDYDAVSNGLEGLCNSAVGSSVSVSIGTPTSTVVVTVPTSSVSVPSVTISSSSVKAGTTQAATTAKGATTAQGATTATGAKGPITTSAAGGNANATVTGGSPPTTTSKSNADRNTIALGVLIAVLAFAAALV